MRTTTLQLLESAGLATSDRCLDVGCGGGHVTLDMARIVGPKGHVLGIDFDPHVLDLAREDARSALHAFADDRSTLVALPRMVQVWGTI